jgi:hypothetical protein
MKGITNLEKVWTSDNQNDSKRNDELLAGEKYIFFEIGNHFQVSPIFRNTNSDWWTSFVKL